MAASAHDVTLAQTGGHLGQRQQSDGKCYDGKAADIFACGVMLFAMLLGEYPFKIRSASQNFTRPVAVWPNLEAALSEEAKDLVERMTACNPAKRPTAHQLQDDPWLQNKHRGQLGSLPTPESPTFPTPESPTSTTLNRR